MKATGDSVPEIAPGAENVGQAQIVSEFSKSFTLDGLFGAADAGAFGGPPADDVQMNANEGDAFYTTQDAMQKDGLVLVISIYRSLL